MYVHLNVDGLNYNKPNESALDVESIIANRLITFNVSNKNVIVSDTIVEFETPAVFVSLTSIVGIAAERLWESTILVYCIEESEYKALLLSRKIRTVLDGYGGGGICDVEHVSTIPQRNTETAPNCHTFAMTFRVLHQEI